MLTGGSSKLIMSLIQLTTKMGSTRIRIRVLTTHGSGADYDHYTCVY